ncbi:MAG: family 16 glycosylhydrolase [Ekhidna sp.]
MKNTSLHTFFIVLFSFTTLTNCGDDQPDPVISVPTNLEVVIEVSELGNGFVTVEASATNALTYEFLFEDDQESITNRIGEASYTYSETGTYTLEVRAYGNGTEFISESNDINIIVTFDTSKPPTTGYSTPESYDGFTLVWSDEFEGNSLNSSNWKHEIGTGSNGWGNNELQFYRSENTAVSDGSLTIEAKKETFSGSNYTSSRIVTQDKQDFKYGRIDIRAALPYGKGIWPALWMLGANFPQVGWPKCGEIDIMEYLGQTPDEVFGTLHWADDSGNRQCTCGDQNSYYSLSSGTFSDEWHVFSLIWTENRIEWLVDDNQFYAVDIIPGLEEFNESFFFIFNMAVGGDLPGSPDSQTPFPQRLYVDYVRVFQPN